MYTRAGSSINAIISILFDGENISFDASLVIYINSTTIPPIIIMNKMYENQNLLYIVPLIKHTIVVWISSISPMARGCFICVNISLFSVLLDVSNFVISGGILFKMLVLGINEMVFDFPLKFKRFSHICSLQRLFYCIVTRYVALSRLHKYPIYADEM
jgi:hypothetical protein